LDNLGYAPPQMQGYVKVRLYCNYPEEQHMFVMYHRKFLMSVVVSKS